MTMDMVLLVSNLSEGIKTGLYDFFNKSFTIDGMGSKYLRMKVNSGVNANLIPFKYNEKFNCMYLLTSNDLGDVEPPFLSRFQKHRFSLKEYRSENNSNLHKRVEQFGKRIDEICQNSEMGHLTFRDLFMNSSPKGLESLAMAAEESIKEKEGLMGNEQYREAIRRLIYNSGQEFYYLFKIIIDKSGNLGDVKEIIREALEFKQTELAEKNLLIQFTNEKDYLKRYQDSSKHRCVEFITIKKETNLLKEVNSFFRDKEQQVLIVFLRALEESKHLNYVISHIEKTRKEALI